MSRRAYALACLLWVAYLGASAQLRPGPPAFTVVPLGVKGGLAEGNLSAYLVAAAGRTDFICLDAGSLRPGVEKAVAAGGLAAPAGRAQGIVDEGIGHSNAPSPRARGARPGTVIRKAGSTRHAVPARRSAPAGMTAQNISAGIAMTV